MSAPDRATPLLTYKAHIAGSLECEWAWSTRGGMQVIWSPQQPRRLAGQALRNYKAGRHAFMQRLAALTGKEVLLVDEADEKPLQHFTPPPAGHA